MVKARFKAVCPFEIGDRVKIANTGTVHIITDIACIHYVKSNSVMFRYEFDGSGQYVEIASPKTRTVAVTVDVG